MPTERRVRQYSGRVYAAPFGRYEGNRPADYPAHEVLLGRERERSRMLDWLLSLGSRGAYLITGYRGVGKTSFINFSLQRYAEDVYGRYQQSRVGRAFWWDRVLLTLALGLALLLPLFASQLGDLIYLKIADPTSATSTNLHPLRLLFVGALVLCALGAAYPLAYGFGLLKVAAGIGDGRRLAMLAQLATFALVWYAAPLASPRLAAASLLAMLGWTYFANRGLSISAETYVERDPSSEGFSTPPRVMRLVCAWTLLLGSGAVLLVPRYFESNATKLQWTYLAIAIAAALSASVVRICDAYLLASRLFADDHSQRMQRTQVRNLKTNTLIALSSVIAAAGVLWLRPQAFAFVPIFALTFFGLLAVALCARALLSIGPRRRGERVWFGFHPRPRLLIALKALFAFSLGVQFLLPLPQYLLDGTWLAALAPKFSLLSAYRVAAASSASPPFWSAVKARTETDLSVEIPWLLGTLLFISFCFYLEHDWIARRHERARRDDAYDPATRPAAGISPTASLDPLPSTVAVFSGANSRIGLLHLNRELMKATTFFWIFQTWMPLITVRVNLGFDDLSHGHVVASMMEGLRNEFYRTFISLRSRLGMLSSLLAVSFNIVLSMMLGGWIAPRGGALWPAAHEGLMATLSLGTSCGEAPAAREHLYGYLLTQPPGECISVCVYQLAVFAVLSVITFTARRRSRIFHYSSTYRRLNKVIDSLSSTVREREHILKGAIQASMAMLSGTDRSLEKETPRQDPRSIEQVFLDVLEDILAPQLALPIPGHMISLPAPQITFVFDELDKVGSRSSYKAGEPMQVETHSAGSWADRERSRRVHRLLADMKNLLSVAPARFIFVGGRDLHDEWLADRSARQPLLPNVFDAEIYLPTLLVDVLGEERLSGMTRNVHVYLNARLHRSFLLHDVWQKGKRGLSIFGTLHLPSDHFFLQEPNSRGPFDASATSVPNSQFPPWISKLPSALQGALCVVLPRHARSRDLTNWTLYDASDSRGCRSCSWSAQFIQMFSEYLAFRSRGSPKRLDAIIESYVRPTGRVVRDPAGRWQCFDCQHVLRFGHTHRVSIQFVAELFRRLDGLVSLRAEHSEDKNVRSAFYLADFLMKFHRRAFAWTSLERIDEVLHMHRAPDLRGVLGDLVLDWSQRFLQPILNGMYAFRFRSEIAAEIRYISRCSESEMAAFNFTLDESQALKGEYQRRLGQLHELGDALWEVRAILGELHDFDEDYEEARRHYEASIEALDAQIEKAERTGLLSRALDGASSPPLRRHVEWGVLRLRSMLQIGMTYERSRAYEQALAEYRNAATFARALWFAMLDSYARGTGSNPKVSSLEPTDIAGRHRLDILKHLHIVYQPTFAAAWIGEKGPAGIDTGPTMVEQALWEIRQRLPFVRVQGVRRSEAPAHPAHANFALCIADLHHNAGNLYFFKGSQNKHGSRLPGYLDQARYHYAVSLHEVRRLQTHRCMSEVLRPFPRSKPEARSPLPRDLLPDFALRRAMSALSGLSGVWLAQISLDELIWESWLEEKRGGGCLAPNMRDLRKEFLNWLSSAPEEREATAPEEREATAPDEKSPLALQRWFGTWLGTKPGEPRTREEREEPAPGIDNDARVIRMSAAGSSMRCLEAYLAFSRLGAMLLAEGGHYEEAAHELLRVASSMETLVSALEVFQDLDERSVGSGKSERACKLREELRALGVDVEEGGGRPPAYRAITLALTQGCAALQSAHEQLRLRFSAASAAELSPWVPAHAKRLVRTLALASVRHVMRLRANAETDPEVIETMQEVLRQLRAVARQWVVYRARLKAGPAMRGASNGEIEQSVSTELALHRERGVLLRELHDLLEFNAYPVLNHLMTLRELVLDRLLWRELGAERATCLRVEEAHRVAGRNPGCETQAGDTAEPVSAARFPALEAGRNAHDLDMGCGRMLEELSKLSRDYDCPWLFTPLHAGSALGFFALKDLPGDRNPSVDALRLLLRSQHTYGSRAAYYESIAQLHYLDDDFNDRCVQVRHALQMMGSDLSSLLVSRLSTRLGLGGGSSSSFPPPPVWPPPDAGGPGPLPEPRNNQAWN